MCCISQIRRDETAVMQCMENIFAHVPYMTESGVPLPPTLPPGSVRFFHAFSMLSCVIRGFVETSKLKKDRKAIYKESYELYPVRL